MSKIGLAVAIVVSTLALSGNAPRSHAAEPASLRSEILRVALDWEHVKFQMEDRDEQERQMALIAQHAADIAQRYKNAPESLIWVGIITSEQSSMANENGSPFKALGLAKRARDILEKVEKIDPMAADAGAPTSLGVLYYRVPGFPIGFGDKTKARQYLQEAIANAPLGLDANYFYGDFLYEQHKYAEAGKVLTRAFNLPPHPERPIWDQSRRLVIKDLLAKIPGGAVTEK